jgi:hypothetical protein
MSHRQSISRWEIALAKLIRRRKQNASYPLMDDIVYTMLGCIADDLTDHYISEQLTCSRFLDHCKSIGLINIIDINGRLSDYLRKGYPLDERELFHFWKGFKHQLNTLYGRGPIPSVIAHLMGTPSNHDDSVRAFRRLEQFLCFSKRANLENQSLLEETRESFLRTCVEVSDFNSRSQPLPLLQEVRRIALTFAHFEPDTWSRFGKPKHGPGATRELKSRDANAILKLQKLVGDSILCKYADYPYLRTVVPRVSELVIVPKSATKMRTIAKEPTALMWAQQAIKGYLDPVMDRRKGINLHDGAINGQQALDGSIDGRMATIDLSAASDRVSLRVFHELFRGSYIYDAVLDTRSSICEVRRGQFIELPMVSTMGSAVCFPIETIVFYSIAKAVLQLFGYTGEPYVYGDDIIVPTKFAGYVMDVLEAYGFVVNREKSFTNPRFAFRESCGVNGLLGLDVTPKMMSRFHRLGRVSGNNVIYDRFDRSHAITHFGSFLEMSEWTEFKLLRSFLIRLLRSVGITYYDPQRGTFSWSDPNNSYKFSSSSFRDHRTGRIFTICDIQSYVVSARPVEHPVNYRGFHVCSADGYQFDASEHLRWFAYWHYPMYDADGYYVGVDKILLPAPTRLVLTTIMSEWT